MDVYLRVGPLLQILLHRLPDQLYDLFGFYLVEYTIASQNKEVVILLDQKLLDLRLSDDYL